MDSRLVALVQHSTVGFESVVDYGCGNMDYLATLTHIGHRVGIDIVRQEPFMDEGAKFIEGDFRRLVGKYPLHVALFLDTIEHVVKEEGLALLDQAKEAHRMVIVFTPKGFWDNAKAEAINPTNPHQKHLSGWEPEDFPGFKLQRTTIGPSRFSIYGVWTR